MKLINRCRGKKSKKKEQKRQKCRFQRALCALSALTTQTICSPLSLSYRINELIHWFCSSAPCCRPSLFVSLCFWDLPSVWPLWHTHTYLKAKDKKTHTKTSKELDMKKTVAIVQKNLDERDGAKKKFCWWKRQTDSVAQYCTNTINDATSHFNANSNTVCNWSVGRQTGRHLSTADRTLSRLLSRVGRPTRQLAVVDDDDDDLKSDLSPATTDYSVWMSAEWVLVA